MAEGRPKGDPAWQKAEACGNGAEDLDKEVPSGQTQAQQARLLLGEAVHGRAWFLGCTGRGPHLQGQEDVLSPLPILELTAC